MEENEARLTIVENTLDNHEKRITAHGHEIDELKIDNAVQNETLRQILDVTSETKAAVKMAQEKPAKRWEGFVMSMVTALGAGLVGAALLWLGLKP